MGKIHQNQHNNPKKSYNIVEKPKTKKKQDTCIARTVVACSEDLGYGGGRMVDSCRGKTNF
jgi:hypothetical protein